MQIELEIPAPVGTIQVRLKLATAFTLYRLLDTVIESDVELAQMYANCLSEWETVAPEPAEKGLTIQIR